MNDQVEVPVLSKAQQKKLAAQKHNEVRRDNQVPDGRVPTLEETAELEALSKEVFGSTSHYKTILKKGTTELVTENVTEYVPAVLDADGKEVTPEETRVVQVPVKYRSPKRGLTNINQLRTVKHTVESVKDLMLERKKQQDAFRAMMAKMEADKKEAAEKERLNKLVQEKLSGSAI